MGAVKNLFVRIGGDASGAVNSFKSASSAGSNAKESIKKSSAETKKAIRDGFSSPVQSIRDYASTVSRTKEAHHAAAQNVTRLTDKIAQLEDVYGTVKNATDGLDLSKSLTDQISATEKALNDVNLKIAKTQASIARVGNPTSASKAERLAKLQADLQELMAESDETASHLRALDTAASRVGSANMGHASAAGLKSLQEEIIKSKNQLQTAKLVAGETGQKLKSMGIGISMGQMVKAEAERLKQSVASIPHAFKEAGATASAGISRIGNSIKAIPANLLSHITNGFNKLANGIRALPELPGRIWTGLKQIGSSAAQAAVGGIKKLGNSLKNIAGSAVRGLASVSSKLLNIGKSAASGCGGLGKMVRSIRNIGIASLGMRIATGMFGRLRSIISNYIYTNESLSASVTSLRNQMGEALLPAINLVLGAFQRLMPVVVAISNAINAVFEALFGKVSATGKAISSTAAAASSAADSLDVYGFDQITKVSDNSGSGGSGNGGVAAQQTSEQSALVQKLTSWIQQLKAAFVAGDWAGLGAIIGNGINNAVNAINAVDLGTKIGVFANNFFTTLHSALSTIDFAGIGSTVGQVLSSALGKIDAFKVGQTLGLSLLALPSIAVGFIQDTDWAQVGTSLSETVRGCLQTVSAWLQGVDWLQIGDSFATLIANTDWSGIATDLFTALGSALAAVVETLWGFVDGAVVSIKDYFSGKIEEAGGDVAGGLLKGIGDGLVNIGKWIEDNIFKPFMDGFDGLFEINSPSKVLEGRGGFLMKGLLKGIKGIDVWGSLSSWFSEKILSPFTQGFADIKLAAVNAFENMWAGAKGWINELIGGVESMVNGIIRGINRMIEAFNKIAAVGDHFGLDLTISKISTVSLPKLAKGAVVSEPTAAIVGEAGKEAIMPLENNTGWITKLAQQINAQGGGQTFSLALAIYFRSRKMAEYLIKDINQITQETGVCPIYL